MTSAPDFDGRTFEPAKDGPRLGKQLRAVLTFMLGSVWRSLDEISESTGYPQASISARLRDLRKPKFGEYTVQRQRRRDGGTFEYRVVAQVRKSQCLRCREYVDDPDDVGVLAHLAEDSGCGYCSHPSFVDGSCTLCRRPEQHEQMDLGL